MKTDILVADAMTTKPVTCSPELTLIHVANLMTDENVGSVIIVDKEKAIGIITETDFVQKVSAKNVDVINTTVKDFMTTDIVGVTPDVDIIEALQIMKKHDLRRLPVMNDKKLAGMLTHKDILRIQPELFELMSEMNEIREAHRKPLPLEDEELGVCESCSNYGLVRQVDGIKQCRECA